MTIVNSAAVFEDHFPWIKKATVVIEYGKPIYIDELPKEERKAIGTKVQAMMMETYLKNKAAYFPESVVPGKDIDEQNTAEKGDSEN